MSEQLPRRGVYRIGDVSWTMHGTAALDAAGYQPRGEIEPPEWNPTPERFPLLYRGSRPTGTGTPTGTSTSTANDPRA